MAHTHPCTLCGQHFDCDGPMVPNFDGWPDPVCAAQMEANLDYQHCPGCREHGCCESCDKAPATGDGHKPFFCAPCEAEWLDNYDGPEPDYDAIGITEQCDRAREQRNELRRRD